MLVRLPNFLTIDTKPFDPATYEDEKYREVLDDDGKARVRLRVENTIRWRYAVDDDGEVKKDDKVWVCEGLVCLLLPWAVAVRSRAACL